jgi:hypothetical protein
VPFFFRKIFWVVFFITLISTNSTKAQRFLPDTFYVDFIADTVVPLRNVAISEVVDLRNEDSRFVRYGSKNKFLLFPVDQEVYLKVPLKQAIIQQIPRKVPKGKAYSLEIKKFVIDKQSRRFSQPTILSADLLVYERSGDSNIYKGTLIYDYLYIPKSKKENLTRHGALARRIEALFHPALNLSRTIGGVQQQSRPGELIQQSHRMVRGEMPAV